jgi:hypothetical protein
LYADFEGMAARIASLLPRLAALTLIWLLATSTITFAASARKSAQKQEQAPTPRVRHEKKILIVPDVTGQAYVFAKGILDDGGFGWRVEGSVQGYAANTVADQSPEPGTKVVDTGAPTIVLQLKRNPDYDERGLPENSSPRPGTKLVLATEALEPAAPAEKKSDEPAKDESEAPANDGSREPDFHVPGAPPEPTDELPLPDRARLLEKRLAASERPTRALVKYWLYQHAWIVTGARFGWHDGAEALEILIRVDEDLEARWGVGGRSAAVARAALAEIESKAGS